MDDPDRTPAPRPRDAPAVATAVDARASEERAFPAEALAVWSMFALVAAAVFVTYARVPADELYNVSGTGLAGGASRALVFLNYPLALVAIAIVLVLLDRTLGREWRWLALAGGALSAAIFWPGIVTQADLDARTVNAIPAAGVVVTAVLTLSALRAAGRTRWQPRQPGDAARIVLGALVVCLALPWIGADLGVSFRSVAVLGDVFQTTELAMQPGALEPYPAVHAGHHHGMDGALLVVTALLLSRLLAAIRRSRLRTALLGYLALMLTYGLGNLVQDFWLEQVVKRGWTAWEIPSVTTPSASPAWAGILVSAVVVWAAAARWLRPSEAPAVVSAPDAA